MKYIIKPHVNLGFENEISGNSMIQFDCMFCIFLLYDKFWTVVQKSEAPYNNNYRDQNRFLHNIMMAFKFDIENL